MTEHELLLRHVSKWADAQGRPLDLATLEEILTLRSTHDGLAANQWPAGSVRHVLLERWPSHGPVDTPDVPALVAGLETFLRFLFTTGRIAAGSAGLKELLRETQVAGRQMAAACADPANHGHTKALLTFGREIGLTLDDLSDIDELNAVLEQIVTAWNDLPMAERVRRSPGPAHAGSRMGQAMTDAVGTPPDEWRLPQTPRLDADSDPRMFPADPAVTAPQFRASAFVKEVLALVDWVGEGRQVTATGVLRPAVAREAVADLGLDRWEDAWDAAGLTSPIGEPWWDDRLVYDGPAWRSAADCLALDRLWLPAVNTGLIRVSSTKAVANRRILPATDEGWAMLGQNLLLSLGVRAMYARALEPLLGVLLSITGGRGPRTVEQIRDWWWDCPANDLSETLENQAVARSLSDRELARCLVMFGDTGAWIDRRGTLRGTEIGSDLTLVIMSALDRGILEL